MTAKHEEDKKLIEELKNDLKDKKKTSECEKKNKAAEVKCLTQENQQLNTDNKRLQSELDAAKKEQVDPKQLQDDQEACSRLTEAIRKERDWSKKAYRRIKAQKEEISEKTLALEKSQAAEELLRSILSNERQQFEQMDLQRQASVDQVGVVSN
ncbi:hypothetical protein L3Q82_011608 [Scortum barcoo]|uniref:Uncharacterized protein n=1 Tax=Scortum barcoo TaxID=214431 RepID=A0ACB8W825_9TELE|nr:hypothetical protein L3Q82_011608 [Scortum barcoo]